MAKYIDKLPKYKEETLLKEFKIKPRKRFIIDYVKKLFIGDPIEIDIE